MWNVPIFNAQVTLRFDDVTYDGTRNAFEGIRFMASGYCGGSGVGGAIRIGALLIGCYVVQAKAQAQSFDCSKATTAVEQAICNDRHLGRLDEELARDLKAALAAVADRRELLLADQRRWLAYRDGRCRDASWFDDCLRNLYGARVEHLQALVTPSAAMCQKFVQGYRVAPSPRPGATARKVLVSAQPPEISSGETFPYADDVVAQLHERAKAQQPAFMISQELIDALNALAEETGTIGSLDKMPGRDLYSVTHEQGSAHCLTSQFFVVENGYAKPVKGPAILDESPGTSCGVSRGFVRIDGIPALIQSRFDRTPSMSGTQVIVTWDENLTASGCALSYSYAPKFGPATFHRAKEMCEGPLCDGLRTAARELVEAVQMSPKRARERLRNGLTEAQRAEYDSAVEPLLRGQGAADEEDPQYITDVVPLLLPYVQDGKVYVASVGHFKPYGDIFADWSVKFEAPVAGKLAHAATFAVGMERGELEDLSISFKPRW